MLTLWHTSTETVATRSIMVKGPSPAARPYTKQGVPLPLALIELGVWTGLGVTKPVTGGSEVASTLL